MTTEEKEKHWSLGNKAAYRAILLECAAHLDDEPMQKLAGYLGERTDAIRVLRRLCERSGIPSDWPDDLHLADIIEKHIAPYWPEEEDEE